VPCSIPYCNVILNEFPGCQCYQIPEQASGRIQYQVINIKNADPSQQLHGFKKQTDAKYSQYRAAPSPTTREKQGKKYAQWQEAYNIASNIFVFVFGPQASGFVKKPDGGKWPQVGFVHALANGLQRILMTEIRAVVGKRLFKKNEFKEEQYAANQHTVQ
jgi:hypothetical protein